MSLRLMVTGVVLEASTASAPLFTTVTFAEMLVVPGTASAHGPGEHCTSVSAATWRSDENPDTVTICVCAISGGSPVWSGSFDSMQLLLSTASVMTLVKSAQIRRKYFP